MRLKWRVLSFQARTVLEREFNNLLVVGTDRRFSEVSSSLITSVDSWSVGCVSAKCGDVFKLSFVLKTLGTNELLRN